MKMELLTLQNKLKQALSEMRYRHSLGVQQTAVELALRFGVDAQKAAMAGLLHDCAREIPNDRLLKRAKEFGIVFGSLEQCSTVLLHAAVGAYVAGVEYGVLDEEIHSAIALHTTGGPNMSKLDKIIFLADFIEPNREYPGVEALRKLADIDLDRAVLAAFDQTLHYLVEKKMVIHPASVAGRNELLLTCEN
jgi:predicted HD superfamily hydrolase involved in NAD metabolism